MQVCNASIKCIGFCHLPCYIYIYIYIQYNNYLLTEHEVCTEKYLEMAFFLTFLVIFYFPVSLEERAETLKVYFVRFAPAKTNNKVKVPGLYGNVQTDPVWIRHLRTVRE